MNTFDIVHIVLSTLLPPKKKYDFVEIPFFQMPKTKREKRREKMLPVSRPLDHVYTTNNASH